MATTAATKTAARKKTANDAAEDQVAEAEVPIEVDQTVPEETEQWFQSPGFARMREDWNGEDRNHMQRMQAKINAFIFTEFQDSFAMMSDLYDVVRFPMWEDDEETIPLRDATGFIVWAKDARTGKYIEDWTRLTEKQKQDFLYTITTSIFVWSQKAADLHTEAMFAKAMWTERHAIEFDKPMSGTIDDRNAVANQNAAEERFFALMKSAVSRKADALVRSMEIIGQRIKDTLAD